MDYRLRIKPGRTVVTTIPYEASSARNPLENPVNNANLLALYGNGWALTLPPMEITMRPERRWRILTRL